MHRFMGMLGLSFKQLRHRLLESLLILLGIALGVGVLTGVEAYQRFFTDLQREMQQWDTAMASVTVQPRRLDTSAFFSGDGVPALPVSSLLGQPVTFTVEHLVQARREVALVSQATVTGSSSFGSTIEAIDGQTVRRTLPDATNPPTGGFFGGDTRPPSSQTPGTMLSLQVTVVTPDTLAMQGRVMRAGRGMTWDEYEEGAPVIVLEEDDVPTLFPGLAPEEAIGRTVTSGRMGSPVSGGSSGMLWRIIGVVAKDESPLGMMSRSPRTDYVRGYAAHSVLSADSIHINGLAFSPHRMNDMEQLVEHLETHFAGVFGDGAVELTNPMETRARLEASSRRSTVTLMTLAGAALFVAAINILNLFTARVLRRRRAAAMTVALGARRRWLFHQVFAEALLLGVGGSVIGIGIASGVVQLLRTLLLGGAAAAGLGSEMYSGLGLQVVDVGFGLAIGVAVSVIFGLYPAYVGASMVPADGLRTE